MAINEQIPNMKDPQVTVQAIAPEDRIQFSNEQLGIDKPIEISIQEMIEHIRNGQSIEVIYVPNEDSNIITLVCDLESGQVYCNDIRELHTILATHGDAEVRIRSHRKEASVITEWKEYYIHSPSIYQQLQKLNIKVK